MRYNMNTLAPECGLWTCNTGLTWGLSRSAESRSPLKTCCISTGTQGFPSTVKSEKLWSKEALGVRWALALG